MLLKWMVCKVKPEQKERFTQAQTHWGALRYIQGFLGQIGGWNHASPDEACILGLWQDASSYRRFMCHFHDGIFINSNQGETYDSISVTLSRRKNRIPGEYPELFDCLQEAGMLHTMEIKTSPSLQWTDEKAQGTENNPGIKSGVISQVEGESQRILMMTLWGRTRPEQEGWAAGWLERPGMHILQERRVTLEKRWCVLPGDKQNS